jgi:hypothetical protein
LQASLIAPSRNRRGDLLSGAIHERRAALIELFLTFAATVAIFAPTFAMALVFTELFERIHAHPG